MKLKLFACAFSMLFIPSSTQALTIINEEFGYDLSGNIVEQRQISPIFSINNKTEVELPIE